MEKPNTPLPPAPAAASSPSPTSSPSPPPEGSSSSTTSGGSVSGRRKPPTPEELVAHYEAQGLDYKEASLKVVQELQGILYQTALSGRKKKDKFMADTLRKLDNVNTRLAIVESKLDTKPGFPEAIAIGVAAGSAVPLVLGGLGHIWSAVKSTTDTTHHSPPS